MTTRRKRCRPTACRPGRTHKKPKTDHGERMDSIYVEHPTLCLYYPRVSTLRNYLLSNLPASSRSRRRRITSIGRQLENVPGTSGQTRSCTQSGLPGPLAGSNPPCPDSERSMATFLDKTLVCAAQGQPRWLYESRQTDFAVFSQQFNLTAGSSCEEEKSSICDVCQKKYREWDGKRR